MLHWTRHWASVVVGSTEQWPVVGWSQHQSSPLHHDQNTLAWQLLLSAGAHLTCNYCLKTHQLPMLCCHELYWMVFCWVGRGGQLGRRGAMCVVCWRELVHWSHSSTTHWPAGKWIKTDSFHYFRRGNILINNFTKPVRLFRKLDNISIVQPQQPATTKQLHTLDLGQQSSSYQDPILKDNTMFLNTGRLIPTLRGEEILIVLLLRDKRWS